MPKPDLRLFVYRGKVTRHDGKFTLRPGLLESRVLQLVIKEVGDTPTLTHRSSYFRDWESVRSITIECADVESFVTSVAAHTYALAMSNKRETNLDRNLITGIVHAGYVGQFPYLRKALEEAKNTPEIEDYLFEHVDTDPKTSLPYSSSLSLFDRNHSEIWMAFCERWYWRSSEPPGY